MKIRLVTVLAIILPISLAAQKRPATPKLEDLPRIPIDTVDTQQENVKIVTFTNNTWEYHYTDLDQRLKNEVFENYWDTTQVFSYKMVELKDLPPAVEIDLVETLEDFCTPIVGRISSKYGPRGRRNHRGVDVPLQTGKPIFASFSGKVRYAKYNTGGFGNPVIVRHENGLETWYAHLSKCNVKANQYVKAGTVIGYGGNTGRGSGAHLHFEVRYFDQNFDPERIIDFTTGDLRYTTFSLDKSYLNIYSRSSETLEEDDYESSVLSSSSPDGLTSEQIIQNIEANERAVLSRPKPTDPLYHTIRSGDNLSKIARQYGTTVSNLCKLNNITPNSVIKAGKRLRVR